MVFNRALQERNEKRKEEVKYIDVDPVACAALIWENNFIDHRYQLKYKKNSSPNLWETDEFIDVKHLVGKSHRDQGQKIREYFGNKILMLQLSSKSLSPWRQDLIKYLTRQPTQDNLWPYRPDEVALIMSLPRLYAEDDFLEDLKTKYNNDPFDNNDSEAISERVITFIGKHIKKSHKFSRSRYSVTNAYTCNWFHDDDARLHLIETEDMDPFRHIWTEMIRKPITIHGKRIKHNSRDGLNFYMFHDWYILNK